MHSTSSAQNLVGATSVTSSLHCCYIYTPLDALLLCKPFNATSQIRCPIQGVLALIREVNFLLIVTPK